MEAAGTVSLRPSVMQPPVGSAVLCPCRIASVAHDRRGTGSSEDDWQSAGLEELDRAAGVLDDLVDPVHRQPERGVTLRRRTAP